MKHVRIVFKDGKANIDINGFTGTACTTDAGIVAMKQALGAVEDETLKPEYYEQEQTGQQEQSY